MNYVNRDDVRALVKRFVEKKFKESDEALQRIETKLGILALYYQDLNDFKSQMRNYYSKMPIWGEGDNGASKTTETKD